MIRIYRPGKPPSILLNKGEQSKQAMCRSYDNDSRSYDSGDQKFAFCKNIHSHKSVKDALLKSQHGKCCYCESKSTHNTFGAIDHFRPKGAVKQGLNEDDQLPGYYWLAYDWSNLLFCCDRCNVSKGTLFPLEEPAKRARNHHDDLNAESPLFVDPSQERPEEHLRFHKEVIHSLTERGKKTIDGIGLNRPHLVEARLKRLRILECLKYIVLADTDHQSEAEKLLGESKRPCEEFEL